MVEQSAKFLGENRIKSVPFYIYPVYYVKAQKQPFANKLWIDRLDKSSGFDGYNSSLGIYSWICGVNNLPSQSEEALENLVQRV